MQKSRVKVHDQGRKITFWKLEHRCQLIVKLQANKFYQKLLCCLSSYINLLNLLNFQGLHGRLLTLSRFQTSNPWSRPLTNSDLKRGAYTRARVCQIVWSIVWSIGCDPTALRTIPCFVAIWPLSDESLDLGRLIARWFLVVCSFPIACSIVDYWLVARLM